MAVETRTVFDEYKVTNGSVRWKDKGVLQPSIEIGCVGSLELETEMKVISKTCEGDLAREVSKPSNMTATLSAHVPVEVFRTAFGLKNEGLKEGVWAYGDGSKSGEGVLTFDVIDLDESMTKMLAFPNFTVSDGFKWKLENGGDEIVEIELALKMMKDDNGKLYYEALEHEVLDVDVKTKWHTEFTPELVKQVAANKSTKESGAK